MEELTRRAVLKTLAVAGTAPDLITAFGLQKGADMSEEEKKIDRQRVIACGLTEAEADCWETLAEAVGMFFKLPKLHPADAEEVALAAHVIQHKLLSRPTYRKYLELARSQKK